MDLGGYYSSNVVESMYTVFSDRQNFCAQPEHNKKVVISFSFFKTMIAHLSNSLLPQHALHQVLLTNHVEMSVVLLLSGISDTAHLSRGTSEALLICFLV